MKTDVFFELPIHSLKPALLVSLLSVWVLVGVFAYLNRYTRRRYFSLWTAAWLFYALWLTLSISLEDHPDLPLLLMLKQWCVGTAAAFMLWGATSFLELRAKHRLFGLFMAFLFVWSYIGAYHLEDPFWVQQPIFSLMGLASVITAWSFSKMRMERRFIGAGLLCPGFLLWGLYLTFYPMLQASEHLESAGFFVTAVLQLFIAVSMIVLVLEEVRVKTDRTLAELATRNNETQALRTRVASTEERYRSLFDQASEGIVIAEAGELRVLELNQTAQRLLGLAATEPHNQFLPSFCDVSQANGPKPRTGDEWFQCMNRERQFNLVRRDGSITPVEVDAAPVTYDGGKAYQFFFREMTERTRLEQQLRQAEKLSALGQMISGVAHELNNPLAVIKGYLELVLARHELNPQTRVDLEKVSHEADRTAKLVSNFLSFAREQPLHRQRINLNDVVHRVVELREFDLRAAHTDVVLDLAPDLPDTLADADQMQQVLVNLVNNAIQAMADKQPKPKLKLTTSADAEKISVCIEDNGPGIPPEILPHIFEPFFTTKEVGTGTGLGLSIAHSIMTDHKGRIYHHAPATGGAGFCLELPVLSVDHVERKTDRIVPAAVSDRAAAAGAKILILDDEKSIAELLGEMLQILGYSVMTSNSPHEALSLLDGADFDVVLSDFRMPLMDGQEFYRLATEKHPRLARRIIFLTGDVVNEDTVAFLESTGNPHLPKPFQLASVEKVIETALRSAG